MTMIELLIIVVVLVVVVGVGYVVVSKQGKQLEWCSDSFNGSYCWGDCEQQPKTMLGMPSLGQCLQCYANDDARCKYDNMAEVVR